VSVAQIWNFWDCNDLFSAERLSHQYAFVAKLATGDNCYFRVPGKGTDTVAQQDRAKTTRKGLECSEALDRMKADVPTLAFPIYIDVRFRAFGLA
jgi:hypothetical protein